MCSVVQNVKLSLTPVNLLALVLQSHLDDGLLDPISHKSAV